MTPPSLTIVAGVDGSDTSIAALRWALTEASLTGADVDALIAWQWPMSLGTSLPIPSGFDPKADATTMLDEIVATHSLDFPSVTVQARAIEGHPGAVLVEASRHADLLVVGCRGHGELAGMVLGSVSLHCAAHAASPVVVFRPEAA